MKTVGLLVLGGLLALLVMWAWRNFGDLLGERVGGSPLGLLKRGSTRALRKKLLSLVHDPEVASRLVAAAKKRHPELSDAAILRRVIRRLERDRGR